MNKRKIANSIRFLFKIIGGYILLIPLIFIGRTFYNNEVLLLLKKKEITLSVYQKHFYDSLFYGDNQTARELVSEGIYDSNIRFANKLTFTIVALFLAHKIIVWIVQFVRKYAD